jgi:hypothetical protein
LQANAPRAFADLNQENAFAPFRFGLNPNRRLTEASDGDVAAIAFSSEVDTGSREENALNE